MIKYFFLKFSKLNLAFILCLNLLEGLLLEGPTVEGPQLEGPPEESPPLEGPSEEGPRASKNILKMSSS